MPRIQRTQRQISPNGARLQQVDVSSGRMQSARALQKHGGALQNFGGAIQKKAAAIHELHVQAQKQRDDLDMFETKMALTEFSGSQEIRQKDYDGSISGNGRDHTANRLVEFDGHTEALLKGLPNNKKAQQFAQLQLAKMRASYGARSYARQQAQLEQHYTETTSHMIATQIVPRVEGTLESAQSSLTHVENILSAADGMPDRAKKTARDLAVKAIYNQWLAKAGPNAAADAERVAEALKDGAQSSGIVAQFHAKLATSLPQIEDAARAQERELEVDTRRNIRELEQQTEREGFELLFEQKLTKEWVQANEDRLSNSTFVRFMNHVTPRGRMTDPEIYRGLLERATENPEEVAEQASEAYEQGTLNLEDWRRIYGKTRRALKSETRLPPWAKETRSMIKSALKPDRHATPAEREAYQDALEDADEFMKSKGKDLDRKELTDFANRLIETTRKRRTVRTRESLSVPKGVTVAKDALTLEHIQAATQQLIDEKANGLSKSEVAKRARVLRQWKELLERDAVK